MGVKSPSDISAAFGTFFNGRDRDGLLDLYAEDALLTIDGETSARGKTAIGEMMAPLLDGPLKISMKCVCCHENGDTAVVRTDWVLNEPDGSVAMAGSSAEVLRHEADGQWRFLIDDATFASRSGPS